MKHKSLIVIDHLKNRTFISQFKLPNLGRVTERVISESPNKLEAIKSSRSQYLSHLKEKINLYPQKVIKNNDIKPQQSLNYRDLRNFFTMPGGAEKTVQKTLYQGDHKIVRITRGIRSLSVIPKPPIQEPKRVRKVSFNVLVQMKLGNDTYVEDFIKDREQVQKD